MKAFIGLAVLLVVLAGTLPGRSSTPVGTEETGSWQITCVDCPRWIDALADRSVRLDDEGHPHLAYGGDHLYYAAYDGNAWHVETADELPAVGSSASLALDRAGQPIVAYYDSLNQNLKVAFRDITGWVTETVDTGGDAGDVGFTTALALDAGGQPHAVYSDRTNQTWKYAHREAAGWRVERIGVSRYDGYPVIAMAVGRNAVPHIAYFDSEDHVLMHGARTPTGWTFDPVLALSGGSSCSLALDADDHPQIAYYVDSQHSGIAHWSGTSWQIEETSWHDYVFGLSLALSPDGFPHMSATVWISGEPGTSVWEYQYRDAAGWHRDQGAAEMGQTSLALDAAGHPHFSYPTRQGIALITFDGAAWRCEYGDEKEDVGLFSSVAIDTSRRPVVAYSAESASMKVASWNGTSWAVDDFPAYYRNGQVSGTSLALDITGQPRVAYAWSYFTGMQDDHVLTYRYRDKAGWHDETVMESPYDGPTVRPSLALNPGGGAEISYYDSLSRDLKLAVYQPGPPLTVTSTQTATPTPTTARTPTPSPTCTPTPPMPPSWTPTPTYVFTETPTVTATPARPNLHVPLILRQRASGRGGAYLPVIQRK